MFFWSLCSGGIRQHTGKQMHELTMVGTMKSATQSDMIGNDFQDNFRLDFEERCL